MNDNITIHFQPVDQRDGQIVKGTAGNSSLDVFANTFISEATEAFSDFQIPTRIIISNSTQYSRSIAKALENSSSIHLRFRIARKSGPMEFASRPVLTTSAFAFYCAQAQVCGGGAALDEGDAYPCDLAATDGAR